MVFVRIILSFTSPCSLLRFGNPSWSGTPFGSASDTGIPFENKKQVSMGRKQEVSFELEDKFKAI